MKIIQAHFGKIDSLRNVMIDRNIDFAKKHKIKHTLITKWPDKYDMPDTKNCIVLSEYLRFYLAADNDDMCWVDTDAVLLKMPEMENGFPYFHETKINTIDYAVFMVNGKKGFFEKLVAEHAKRQIQPVYMGWAKVLRDKEHFVRYIPSTCFEHEQITFKKWELDRKKKSC